MVQAKGKPVVVGGPDVMSSPELFEHADFLVIGEAENVIGPFVEAWNAGARRGRFRREIQDRHHGEPDPALAKLSADETTAPVLDPGRGRTKTGQLFAYARDDRPCGGADQPGVVYVYAPDRKASGRSRISPASRASCRSTATAATRCWPSRATYSLPFCWSQVRRKFYELAAPGPRRSQPRR